MYVNAKPTNGFDPNGQQTIGPPFDMPSPVPIPILARLGIIEWPEDLGGRRKARRTDAVCCADAKLRLSIPPSDAAGVVCCDGRKVSCVFVPGGIVGGGGSGNPIADGIVDRCLIVHEGTHHADIPECPDECNTLTRPGWGPGVDGRHEECLASRAELNCLTQHYSQCGSNSACEAAVDARINFVLRQIRLWCS